MNTTTEYEKIIALADIEAYLVSQALNAYADALERGDETVTIDLPTFTGDVSASTVTEDIREFADANVAGHPDGEMPLTKKDAAPEAVKLGIQL